MAYAHIPESQRNKLDKKGMRLRFVGYSIQSKGYRLLHERTLKVYIRRDVIFNEHDFGHRKESVSTSPEAVEIQPEVVNESELDLEATDPEREPEQRRQSECTR